jgi:hypothetical protein
MRAVYVEPSGKAATYLLLYGTNTIPRASVSAATNGL